MRVDGVSLWLAAGHVIQDLEAAYADPGTTINECVLADSFGESSVSERPGAGSIFR